MIFFFFYRWFMFCATLLPPINHHALWNINPPSVKFQLGQCLQQEFTLPTVSPITAHF